MSEKSELHIAIVSNKGGCGKTTTTINLAQGFSLEGYKTLVVDGDKNSTCKNWSLRRGSDDPFAVITMEETMRYSRPKDIVLWDTAGGIESNQVMNLIKACDYMIIPCKPDMVNMEATETMAQKFMDLNVPFRILIVGAPRAGAYARANNLVSYFKSLNFPLFSQVVPQSMKIVDATDQGKTTAEISGVREITDTFRAIAAQVIDDTSFRK